MNKILPFLFVSLMALGKKYFIKSSFSKHKRDYSPTYLLSLPFSLPPLLCSFSFVLYTVLTFSPFMLSSLLLSLIFFCAHLWLIRHF